MSVKLNGKLGIKTEEGQVVPVLDLRTQRWNQTVFTTIVDRQKKAVFPFYYRDDTDPRWVYLDSLPLDRIPSAPAGIPDLTVKVRVDGQGNLALDFNDPHEGNQSEFVMRTEVLARIFHRTAQNSRPAGVASSGAGSGAVSRSRVQPEPKRRKRTGPVLLVLALLVALTGLYFFLVRPRTEFSLSAERSDQSSPRKSTEAEQNAPPASSWIRTESEHPSGAAKSRISQPGIQRNLPTQVEEVPVPKISATGAGTALSPVWEKLAGDSIDEPIFMEAGECYQITWGDTLWRITERFYGDRDLYPILAERNELKDPDYIISGESLGLPPAIGGRERLSAPSAD